MIVSYHNDYFDQVADLLIKSHHLDTLTSDLVKEKFYDDPNWDNSLCLLFLENEKVTGILHLVERQIREEKIAYIKLMAVAQKRRRRGIATELLYKAENLIKSKGISKLRIYDAPLNYFMPGIDPRYTPAICFALKHHFKHTGDAVNMEVLLNQDFSVKKEISLLSKEGIVIDRAQITDKNELIQFVEKEWALWVNELEMAYRSVPVSIFISKKDGEIKAFSAYNGNNKGTAWFGPMGTHSDLRGMGIGGVLLKLCLNDMKQTGAEKSVIPWVAPVGFYSDHVNAVITRVFWRFEKNIENAE